MRRALIVIVVLVLATLAFPAVAQQARQPQPPLTIKIDSKILGETRTVLVRTPASYASGARDYPVIYMTDGDRQLDHTIAVADFLVREGRMPETIFVAIANTDRTRDLTPTKVSNANLDGQAFNLPTSGGADKFLDFIAAELIPQIEEKYRTQPYRVFAGHSFGGLFALHALFTRPSLFNAVIAVSPTLTWDNRYVYRRAGEWLDANPKATNTLVFSVGDEGESLDREFAALQALLEKRAPSTVEWQALRFADEDHGSVVLPTHYAGLRKAFDPFRFTIRRNDDAGTLYARATEHYAKTSKRVGFDVLIPEATANLIGYRLLQEGTLSEAIEVFRRNAEAYPQSANVYDSLAEAYERSGDLVSAKANYKRAVTIGKTSSDPNLAIYEQNAARVTKALAEKKDEGGGKR